MDTKEAMERLCELFGSRINFLAFQLATLSMSGQPCDVTFFEKKPILDVKVMATLNAALMYGAGGKKLQELLEHIKFSDGTVASIGEIWTINPMPKDGLTDAELEAVDMTEADEKVGPNGETLRQMIRETYHCTTKRQENVFLRRFIAS